MSDPAIDTPEPSACRLCGRHPRRGLTDHHLIPRQCHGNKWFKRRFDRETLQRTIALCRDCHGAVHRFVPSHKELGRHYNTPAALRAHDGIAGFVAWVRKQR